jgi:putative phage-type endonuclease
LKTGLISEPEDNEAMRQGRDLEEYVAQRFAEKSGYKVRRENAIVRNDAFPYIHANIDRKIIGINAGLECKTVSAWGTKRYRGGEFPEHYYAQCVSYMAVKEFDRYYLAAVILGVDFKIYQLTRIKDDTCPEWCESSVYVGGDEIKALRQIAIEFWETNVQKSIPPQMDGTSSTTDTINAIYANSKGGTVELLGRKSALEQYSILGAEIKTLQIQQEKIRQLLKQDLGENESGTCDGFTVTWKQGQRKTFDLDAFIEAYPEIDLTEFYKTSAFRQFRVKGA